MSLQRNPLSTLPNDAVMLSEKEALQYQSYIISKWHRPSDVFSLKYGPFIAGGGTLFSAIYLNNYFRRKFKLLHYGRGASYLPICAMPAGIAFMAHTEFIIKKLLLLDFNTCPICLEVRAAVLQSMMGVVFPLVVAPVGCIALVHKYATINMPYITKEPKAVFNLLLKQIKPIKNSILSLLAGQALLGMVITYFEAKSVFKVHEELSKEPGELESN